MRELLQPLAESEAFQAILAGPDRVARVQAPGFPYVVAALADALEAPVLVVTPGPRDADRLARGVGAFLEDGVALFPAWEALPAEGISPAPEIVARRARAARRARSAKGTFVLVAPAAAALQRLVPDIGTHDALVLEAGAGAAPDVLAERLVALGYARADLVQHRGEFAVRGGIVDVFPGAAPRPVRLDFLGDEVERIREFSPSSQTSIRTADGIEVDPVRELLPTEDVRKLAGSIPARKDAWREIVERLAEGQAFEGMERAAHLLFEDMPVLSELLPEGGWAVLAPARRTEDAAVALGRESEALEEAAGWPGRSGMVTLDAALRGLDRADLTGFTEGVDLGIAGWSGAGRPDDVAAEAARLGAHGYRVAVSAAGTGSVERVLEILGRAGLTTVPRGLAVDSGLLEGFVFHGGRVAVLGEDDVFGRRRRAHDAPRITGRAAASFAEELTPGDFVVHRVHGVATYAGMVHRRIADAERDYLLLEYAGRDRLFVPADQIDAVSPYVGGERPRIHRLGTNDWPRAKARVRRAVRDMAGELVRLYSARMSAKGHAFGPDAPWQRELEDAFPHQETRDQLVAIQDVKRDMESPRPMDRLICGDVGYGKTEIAVRAAFKAVMDGRQVAILVPTTLLAEQHRVTFGERFAPFPVRVEMLSRFLSREEQARVVRDLAQGHVDVVIGTHRLLSKDVRFKDLGLLIVDEEHRFGVAHKERIKRLRVSVDVLTMTATPIPRTLEMALSGIREMSVVDTPPEDRQPVLTSVGPYEEGTALGAARRELRRGGQVFWVHNDVRTIDRAAARLRGKVPEARVGVAHGQMEEATLEKAMLAFWNGEVDVLVCSTIIESGLDVPTANTLVVDRADRLGLAQLYQLRGRVGRSAERAFAYLFFPARTSLSAEAHDRLAAISRFTELGSGYRIAIRDLEIRGAGNLLGAEQHGHIAAVGFDTYVQLLAEVVTEMKGEPPSEEREVRIDLPVRAFLPVGWLGQEWLRLDLYRRISSARSDADLDAIRTEIEDRFGDLPPEAEALVEVARLRVTCLDLGIEEVITVRGQIRVRPVEVDKAALGDGAAYHAATRTLNLDPPPGAERLADWVRSRILTVNRAPEETVDTRPAGE